MIKLIVQDDKNMAKGMRDMSRTPLTNEEIVFVKLEIQQIGADENIFVFNDEEHIPLSTCYNFIEDRIYITRNVFPDTKYGSIHPRDLMSVRAVLAHEYYGHRTYREEYMADYIKSPNFHTTEIWKDECRASITAAKITPNLTEKDKSNLVMDAIYRAQEYNHRIEMDDFMKEVVYGYASGEKNITNDIREITYIGEESQERNPVDRNNRSFLSKMWREARDICDFER